MFEELRCQIYPNEMKTSKTIYNKSKFERARFTSIKGRTRDEIVKGAIEAIKKYGLIIEGPEAVLNNVRD